VLAGNGSQCNQVDKYLAIDEPTRRAIKCNANRC
jgi:hypothetical protein